jgi:hypothetical protein
MPLAIVTEAAVIGTTAVVTAFAVGAASGLAIAAVAIAVWDRKPARGPKPPLGTSYEAACGEDGKSGRAAALNALFDE